MNAICRFLGTLCFASTLAFSNLDSHIPAGYNANNPAPIVFMVHGGNQTIADFSKLALDV